MTDFRSLIYSACVGHLNQTKKIQEKPQKSIKVQKGKFLPIPNDRENEKRWIGLDQNYVIDQLKLLI